MAAAERRRRFRLLQLHRWIGLVAGLLLVLLGLSGSLLCFYQEIDHWLAPPGPQAPLAADFRWQALERQLRTHYPDYAGPWRIEAPLASGWPIVARYYRPPETAGAAFAPRQVTLSTATLAIVQDRFWGRYPMTWLYDLHYQLLLGVPGRMLLAVAALVLSLGTLLGVVLWWPARGRRWRSLRPHLRSGRVRAIYDLHVLGGVYSLPLLGMLLLTGIVLEIPGPLRPLLDGVLGPAGEMPAIVQGQAASEADQAVRLALAQCPGCVLRWLETPPRGGDTYRVNLWQEGDPGYRFPHGNWWVSDRVVAVRSHAQLSRQQRFLAWLHPLHSGEAFGLPGRILLAICGLVPLLLWLTGLLRWWQKRCARAAIRLRHAGERLPAS